MCNKIVIVWQRQIANAIWEKQDWDGWVSSWVSSKGVRLKANFENWQDSGKREGISGKRITRMSPKGGSGIEEACDISLGELGGTDKQKNIKTQAKELGIMG